MAHWCHTHASTQTLPGAPVREEQEARLAGWRADRTTCRRVPSRASGSVGLCSSVSSTSSGRLWRGAPLAAGVGVGQLRSILETCEPRPDVLSGGLADSHFAAQL